MIKVTDEPIKKGTEYKFHTRGKENISTITEFTKYKSITITSVQGKFRADYIYSFAKQDDDTKITLIAKFEAGGFMKIMAPLIKVAIKKADSGQLEKLKGAFEA
ncbi:hypothetical protein ACOI1C_11305 [Bacillus sp. DJP31]|uniref:hypothetical protein n=1 Tax=Bacillus sp. DJP31 TaxID=3409789 RepID=UPI003BB70D49